MFNDSGSVKLSYGEAQDGRMVHVSDVSQGLACGCTCPACKAPLVARKGQQLAAHFAHHVDRSCVAAYETMLHRVAKQIIADRMEVMLPAVDVKDGERWRELRKATVFRPDSVEIEQWQESIRPDIVLRMGTKELLVEIRVTHACTPEKLSLLAERQKAAIEIDLSRLPRHLAGVDLEDQVLRLAPREWLWNPHSATVNAEIQARLAAIQARSKAEIEGAIAAKILSLREAADEPQFPWDEIQSPIEAVKAAGLGGIIGHELVGDVCFAVPRMAWQGWIVFNAIKGNRALWPASVESIHDWLASQRLIKRAFIHVKTQHLSPELTEVWERVPDLRPVTAVLLDYVAVLRREGVIRNDKSGRLEPAPGGLAPARALLAAMSAGDERVKDVREKAIIVLDAVVPHQGARSFGRRVLPTSDWANGWDVNAWMGTYIQDLKATPDATARQGGAAYGHLVTRLNQLAMLGKPSLTIPEGTSLGLPIADALAERAAEVASRRLERETAESKRNEEAAQYQVAARKRQADMRLIDLSRLAYDAMMFDAHGWINGPHPVLGGQSVAESGGWMTEDQCAALYEDLRQQNASKEAERRVADTTDRCRGLLSAEAVRSFGEDQGALWMRSVHPKLGGKRPQDVCLTEGGMARCLTLLKAPGRRR